MIDRRFSSFRKSLVAGLFAALVLAVLFAASAGAGSPERRDGDAALSGGSLVLTANLGRGGIGAIATTAPATPSAGNSVIAGHVEPDPDFPPP